MDGGVQPLSNITQCTIDELMAVCMARTIQDHDVVFNGVAVALPFAAILLAKNNHAPNCVFLAGLPAGVDPKPPFIPPTSADFVMTKNAVTVLPLHEIFDLAQKGQLDRIFFGGAQVDKYGNLNNSMIGNPEKIKVKLPGGAGASNISCFAKNFTIWTSKHKTESGKFAIVDQVDFITTAGHVTPSGVRKDVGLRGGGPDWVITDLGVFCFDDAGMFTVQSTHAGITLDDVRSNTGFEPKVAEQVAETKWPTVEEIALIRELDPLNVRKLEFSDKQLALRFPVAQ